MIIYISVNTFSPNINLPNNVTNEIKVVSPFLYRPYAGVSEETECHKTEKKKKKKKVAYNFIYLLFSSDRVAIW